jgi:hypothetical protein
LAFAIDAEPSVSRVDETSGEQIQGYGTDISIIFDKELVPNQLMTAFNLVYSPDISRSKATGLWSRESTSGFSAGIMYRFGSVLLGVEGRYLRKYESLGFNNFAGQAFFVGPTAFIPLKDPWSVTISWTVSATRSAFPGRWTLPISNGRRFGWSSISNFERGADSLEMTDLSNQNTKRRERLILVGQVAAMVAGVVAILVAVVSLLSFVTNECEVGTPFLPLG